MLYICVLSVVSIWTTSHVEATLRSSLTCKGRNMYIHTLKNGEEICRSCRSCRQGFEISNHCHGRLDTSCKRCPEGTFSRHGRRCKPCKKCMPGSFEFRKCNSYQNTKCRRCTGRHRFQSRDGQCHRCSDCPRGTFIKQKCTRNKDTVCSPCPTGTYSDRKNMFPFCKVCKHCRRFEERIQTCSSTRNAVCGDCRKGFFRMASSHQCIKCSPCYNDYVNPGTQVVEECRKKTPKARNICFPVLRIPRKKKEYIKLDQNDIPVFPLDNKNGTFPRVRLILPKTDMRSIRNHLKSDSRNNIP